MYNIRKETLEKLRKEYPAGARVELISMDDPYNQNHPLNGWFVQPL